MSGRTLSRAGLATLRRVARENCEESLAAFCRRELLAVAAEWDESCQIRDQAGQWELDGLRDADAAVARIVSDCAR